MSSAPETKYTDRDVRDNKGEIERLVYTYLNSYTGEFPFLIDCKMRAEIDDFLPTPLLRGVLNCMRIDPRVTGLPSPLPPQEGVVIQMKDKKTKQRTCDIEEFHDAHGGFHTQDGYKYCGGKYKYNRKAYRRPMRIHPEYTFVAAKTGSKIHIVNQSLSEVHWQPVSHGPGFLDYWTINGSGKYSTGDFFFKTLCKYPSWIRNGVLLNLDQRTEVLEDPTALHNWMDENIDRYFYPSNFQDYEICPHCESIIS